MFSPVEQLHKIAFVGIGGCGSNAVSFVKESLVHEVDYFVFDTEIRTLLIQDDVNRIQIGKQATNGKSAEGIPDVGAQAMLESIGTILEKLVNYSLIFFVGGLGCGTATGALPVLAKHFQYQNSVTIFVTTTPFEFEGAKTLQFAQLALDEIVQYGDSTIVISNQKTFQELPTTSPLIQAYKLANEKVQESILGIFSQILHQGRINLDYANLQAMLKRSGYAVIGKGVGSGCDRFQNAMKMALNTLLMNDYDVSSAQRLFVNITATGNLELDEMPKIKELICECVSGDTPFIWKTEMMNLDSDAISIYLILTGVKPIKLLVTSRLHLVKSSCLSGV